PRARPRERRPARSRGRASRAGRGGGGGRGLGRRRRQPAVRRESRRAPARAPLGAGDRAHRQRRARAPRPRGAGACDRPRSGRRRGAGGRPDPRVRRLARRPRHFRPDGKRARRGGTEMNDAVAALRAGQAVILPTDTVYGLCALPGHEEVLYELKGRDRSKPVALLAADVAALLAAVPGLDRAVLERYLPGAFTLVFDGVGVRVPNLPQPAAAVVREVGVVAATSANLSGGPDPRTVDDVPEEIRAACGAVVDAGELPGTPSTVIDLTGDEPRVLRQGAGQLPE